MDNHDQVSELSTDQFTTIGCHDVDVVVTRFTRHLCVLDIARILIDEVDEMVTQERSDTGCICPPSRRVKV